MHRFVIHFAIVIAIVWRGSPLCAELIIDDFDDAAEVVTPAMIDQFVQTPGVGDLNARRSIRIFGSRAEPTGRIDVNAGGSSAFVAELSDLNPTGTGLRIVSVQSQYDFTLPGQPLSFVDVTEGGMNNAFFLDFKSLNSAIAPRYIRVLLLDFSGSYETTIEPGALSEQPFKLAMPFDKFQFRGGGVGLPDFTKVQALYFTVGLIEGGGPADLSFRMELDRIRVGRIPEPASNALAILGLATVARMRRAGRWSPLRRRRSDERFQQMPVGRARGDSSA